MQRLVLEAFAGPAPTPEHEANHKNGRKDDNRPDNLEWVTRQENMDHAWQTGLCKPRPKKAKPNLDLPPMSVVHEWTFKGPGCTHKARLFTPPDSTRNRPRSDQYALEINGQLVSERVNITAALRLIQSEYLPRLPTRAQRADAAAAQMEA